MTRTAFLGLALAAMIAAQQNQTKIRVGETILLPAPTQPSLILYQAGMDPVAIAISDGLVIDRTTTPWTLKVIPQPSAAAAKWWVDVMLVVLDNAVLPFTITKVPSPLSPVDVYKNGRLMAPKLDYLQVDARTFTFLPGQIPQKGDVLQFRYQEQ